MSDILFQLSSLIILCTNENIIETNEKVMAMNIQQTLKYLIRKFSYFECETSTTSIRWNAHSKAT